RERRLIAPRTPVMSGDEPARREKRARTDEERMKTPAVARPADEQNSNPSYQKPNRQTGDGEKPRIMPVERADGDDGRAERKARRRSEEAAQPSPGSGPGNDAANEKHKRPAYTPQPAQDNSAGGEDLQRRERKQRDEEQTRQREEERARQRQEEQNRQRDEEQKRQREKPPERDSASQRQAPSQPARSEPAREAQRQEKQERRAEQRQRQKS